MRIAILGCGWLGGPLGADLVRRGHRVRGATTTPEKRAALEAAGIEPFVFRLDPDLPAGHDAFFDADALVLNIPPPRGRDDAAAFHLAQVDAVRAAVRAAGAPFVVFTSSTAVYPDLNRAVGEDDAAPEAGPRGALLLAAEARLRADDAFETTVVRLAGLFGPGRPPGRFLAGRTDVAGGAAPVNLLHLDDAVAVLAAVVEGDVRGEVLSACADAHPRRDVFYSAAARALGLPPPTFAPSEAPFKVVDNRRLKARLGYTFQHPDPLASLAPE